MKKRLIDQRIEKNSLLFFQLGLLIAISIVLVAFSIRGKATSQFSDPDYIDTIAHDFPPIVVLPEEVKEKQEEKKKIEAKPDPFDIDSTETKEPDEKKEGPKFALDSNLIKLLTKGTEVDTTVLAGFEITEGRLPAFPGGEGALFQWLQQNIQYPERELGLGIGGRVSVSFIVEKDGSISNIKVVKGVSPGLDREAVRAVKNMPKWRPATQFDKNVRVRVTIPVMFKVVGN